MTGHISRNRKPRLVAIFLFTLLLVVSWWWESTYLEQPGWHRPQGQLSSGNYQVDRVVDGDTLVLKQKLMRVRLQGIDTPETVQADTPVEDWGPEATEFTRRFLDQAGWQVQLEIDGEPIDRYGRHLVFVWHEGQLLNEELILAGLARAKTTFDFSQQKKQRLRQAEQVARDAGRGIWSERENDRAELPNDELVP